jgi:branched-chain amino acid transport system permease protein
MEGPIVGAVIFFAVQEWFSSYGAWYLVAIGAVAIGVVLIAPGGLWGIAARRGWSLLPVGYRVRDVPAPGPAGLVGGGPDGAAGGGDGDG